MAKKIFEHVLAPPQEEPVALADALNEIQETDEGDLSPERRTENSRRIGAVERGESQLIPVHEVEARIRARLANI